MTNFGVTAGAVSAPAGKVAPTVKSKRVSHPVKPATTQGFARMQGAVSSEMSGKTKAGCIVSGFFGGLFGVLAAWLIGSPVYGNKTVKWSVIGLAANFVLTVIIAMSVVSAINAAMESMGAIMSDGGVSIDYEMPGEVELDNDGDSSITYNDGNVDAEDDQLNVDTDSGFDGMGAVYVGDEQVETVPDVSAATVPTDTYDIPQTEDGLDDLTYTDEEEDV